jgi:hypothetical protein
LLQTGVIGSALRAHLVGAPAAEAGVSQTMTGADPERQPRDLGLAEHCALRLVRLR